MAKQQFVDTPSGQISYVENGHGPAVDLVGNDSGGGISQIFAAHHPQRLRSLTLTDCDARDNWPPEAVKEFLQVVAGGGLKGALEHMLADSAAARSDQGFGLWYERVQDVADQTFATYLRPISSVFSRPGTTRRPSG